MDAARRITPRLASRRALTATMNSGGENSVGSYGPRLELCIIWLMYQDVYWAGLKRPRSSMRKVLKKPANNALQTGSIQSKGKQGKTYKGDHSIKSSKQPFLASTADDLHYCPYAVLLQ